MRDVDLKIDKGEFVSLIGHSGCGKSTVLNIVAGLLKASTGGVLLDGKEVNSPGPERAVVFQNHSLLPWLTVRENVALAVDKVLRSKKSRAERREWIEHNLALVNMTHAAEKRPHEISGGMKQRVGIARALAMEPKVLLMDEPFGALDALTRAHLQDQLMEIHLRLKNTVIMITHDVDEAVLLSDRIVMMTNGPSATIGEVLDGAARPAAQAPGARRGPDLHPCPGRGAGIPLRPPRQTRDRGLTRMSERLVVIGNGMASLRFLERLLDAAPGRFAVTCIGAEPVAAYNRVLLSSLLGGEVDEAACTFRGLDWYAEHGITLVTGAPATAIDTAERIVRVGEGWCFLSTSWSWRSARCRSGCRSPAWTCPGSSPSATSPTSRRSAGRRWRAPGRS